MLKLLDCDLKLDPVYRKTRNDLFLVSFAAALPFLRIHDLIISFHCHQVIDKINHSKYNDGYNC